MPQLEVNRARLEVDEDGFLREVELWNEDVAKELALADGIQLTPLHWKVVRYVRSYYLRNGTAPMLRKVCSECSITLSHMQELFPSGAAKAVRKLAGLPNPAGGGCFAGACTLCGGCSAVRQSA